MGRRTRIQQARNAPSNRITAGRSDRRAVAQRDRELAQRVRAQRDQELAQRGRELMQRDESLRMLRGSNRLLAEAILGQEAHLDDEEALNDLF